MAAIDSALSALRDGSLDLLSPGHINQLARDGGHRFRRTRLTPGNTLALFVRQIACGNVACSAMSHLAGMDFCDTAWCAARSRLPIELIHELNRRVIDEIRRVAGADPSASTWRGHRLLIIDGSSDSMPDTPSLRRHYGVPRSCGVGLGFPLSHLMLLMEHHGGAVIDCHDLPGDTHDASAAHLTHDQLRPGDIVLGDDAFASYVHLSLLLQAKAHAIVPTQHGRIVDFTPDRSHVPPQDNRKHASAGKPRSRQVRVLGTDDQIVEYFKPPNMPQWMTGEQWQQIPGSIQVREIRRTVRRNGFRPITVTITTTLLDPRQYPADDLVELRLTRWMIETNIRHLKITLGMDQLKCKTLENVRKERSVFLLVYNCVRLLMLQMAGRAAVNPNRISFANTLAWLRFGDLSKTPMPLINPLRPGRLEPRAIKGRKKQFPYMLRPREQLRSQLRARHCDTT